LLEERTQQQEWQTSALQSALAHVDRVEADLACLASDAIETFRFLETNPLFTGIAIVRHGARIPLHHRRQPSESEPGKVCGWVR
jgi:hypothetical protein